MTRRLRQLTLFRYAFSDRLKSGIGRPVRARFQLKGVVVREVVALGLPKSGSLRLKNRFCRVKA
jgi:hypothetical protein